MVSPEAHITLAVDVMGGDKGPQEILSGLLKSTSFAPRDLKYLLFGPENELNSMLGDNSDWRSIPYEVRHAPEVVGMDEKPIAGIKNKKKSSMAISLSIEWASWISSLPFPSSVPIVSNPILGRTKPSATRA